MHLRISLSLVILSVILAAKSGASWIPLEPHGLVRLKEIVRADAGAAARFAEIKAAADAALEEEPLPVSRIVYEGRLKTDPERIATNEALARLERLEALSQAWLVTGSSRYQEAAIRHLLAWIKTVIPDGNPINDNKLVPLLNASRLFMPALSRDESLKVKAWLRSLAEAQLRTGTRDAGTGRAKGNWQTKRLKLVTYAGILLDDNRLMDEAIKGTRDYIDTNLFADGTSFDFRYRDALHYHVSGLVGLVEIAVALKPHGVDLYRHVGCEGGAAACSLLFMEPFVTGEKVHAEWVRSQAEFDRIRANAGDPEFVVGRPFEPAQAAPLLELAGIFDERWHALAVKARGTSPDRFPTWTSVLAAAAAARVETPVN